MGADFDRDHLAASRKTFPCQSWQQNAFNSDHVRPSGSKIRLFVFIVAGMVSTVEEKTIGALLKVVIIVDPNECRGLSICPGIVIDHP